MLCAPLVSVAANSGGAAPPLTTAGKIAKVNAVVLLLLVVVTLLASFPGTPSSRCSNIAMTETAKGMASTPTTHSSPPPRHSQPLEPPETRPHAREKSPLSLARHRTKQPEGGPPHLTDHTHGDTASSGNKTLARTAPPPHNTLALQGSNTTVEDPSKSHGTITTDSAEKQSASTCSTTLT